jgi:hypothetical protein
MSDEDSDMLDDAYDSEEDAYMSDVRPEILSSSFKGLTWNIGRYH